MFKTDGPLYRFMWLVADMFILGLLWLVFCIPIITVGASTAAAIEVNVRIIRKEETYILKNFWHGFKRNFKDGTKLWIVFALLLFMLYMNYQYLMALYAVKTLHIVVVFLSVILFVLCFLYAFPLITRYENKTWLTMINSMMFALRFPLRTVFTILQLGLIVFSYVFFTMLVAYYQGVPFIFKFLCMILILFGPEFFLMTWGYRGMVVIEKYEKMVGLQDGETQEGDKED